MRISLKIFSSAISLVLIDQLLKYIIRSRGGFYICNEGLAFGIKVNIFFLYGLIAVFLIFLAYISRHNWKLVNSNSDITRLFPYMLIFSGALSNIIDRLYFGCVIDFIDLKIWPVFNLADVYITSGGIMILAYLFRKRKIGRAKR